MENNQIIEDKPIKYEVLTVLGDNIKTIEDVALVIKAFTSLGMALNIPEESMNNPIVIEAKNRGVLGGEVREMESPAQRLKKQLKEQEDKFNRDNDARK